MKKRVAVCFFLVGRGSSNTIRFSRSIVASKKPNGVLHLSVAEPLVYGRARCKGWAATSWERLGASIGLVLCSGVENTLSPGNVPRSFGSLAPPT